MNMGFNLNYRHNKQIINSIAKKIYKCDLIPFIGAGMSAPLYPTWNTLVKNLQKECPITDPVEAKMFKSCMEKGDLINAVELIAKNYSTDFIRNFLGYELSEVKIDEDSTDLDNMAISNLPLLVDNGLIITTNYDMVLNRVFQKYEEIDEMVINDKISGRLEGAINNKRDYIVKIHGSIRNNSSLIISANDYSRVYYNPEFKKTLKNLFNNNALLFLGCSLEKDFTLDLLEEIKNVDFGHSREHFAILKSKGKNSKVFEDNLLKKYNIKPLWYTGDHTESLKTIFYEIKKELELIKKKNMMEINV